MAELSEVGRLLSHLVYQPHIKHVDGLEPIRTLLAKDSDDRVLKLLKREMPRLDDNIRGSIAFLIANRYFDKGELKNIQQLFGMRDDIVKGGVLGALWGEPKSNPKLGPGIVELAIRATGHVSAGIRTDACCVIKNQSGWAVDVTRAIEPLGKLLSDKNHWVRHEAGYTAGLLARKKYDLSELIPRLRRNLKNKNQFVHGPSAWALREMSRAKQDISPAVPELLHALTYDEEWNEPRQSAAGALLHHAKKSAANTKQVNECLKGVKLPSKHKVIKSFLEQLAKLGAENHARDVSTKIRSKRDSSMSTPVDIFEDDDGRFCLTIQDTDPRTATLFEKRGLQGGGYTWEGVLTSLLQQNLPEALLSLDIGAEADNMHAYCDDRALLEKVAELVRVATTNHKLLIAAIAKAGEDLE
jgi:hypothetical protein